MGPPHSWVRGWELSSRVPCCVGALLLGHGLWAPALPLLPDMDSSRRLGLDGMKVQVRAVGPQLLAYLQPFLPFGFVKIPSHSSRCVLSACGKWLQVPLVPHLRGTAGHLLGVCCLAGMLTGPGGWWES